MGKDYENKVQFVFAYTRDTETHTTSDTRMPTVFALFRPGTLSAMKLQCAAQPN